MNHVYTAGATRTLRGNSNNKPVLEIAFSHQASLFIQSKIYKCFSWLNRSPETVTGFYRFLLCLHPVRCPCSLTVADVFVVGAAVSSRKTVI